MRTRRNTNRLYVNVSFFFEFSCVFSASVFSNTNVYLLIQNQNIISVNSLLRQLFNICVNRRRLYGLSFSFYLSLALMCFNRLNYFYYNSLRVFSLYLCLNDAAGVLSACILHIAKVKIIFQTAQHFVIFFLIKVNLLFFFN